MHSRSIKVLLVSSSSGSAGGGESYLYHLAVGLSRLGHRVQTICSTAPEMDKLAEKLATIGEVRRIQYINTYQRPTRCIGAALDLAQQLRLRRIFQDCRPDVLHINQQVAEDGLDLILAARNAGIPFLSTIHIARSAKELHARFGRLRDAVAREVLRSTNATHITVAERAKHELTTRFPFLDSNRVRVVPNGVFFPDSNAATRDGARTRWGVVPGDLVLGSVGRLEAQKAPIFALKIVAALKRRGFPVRYVWIGDGAMRTAFQECAQQFDIADFVHVDGWRDDVSLCLQALDVFLMPSNFEGMPLALLEAMAAGVCCCASDVDGMAEVIEDGLSGYLCARGSLDSWCRQIEPLLVNPALRGAIGSSAKRVAGERFGVERMAKDTVKVYAAVTSKSPQARTLFNSIS